MAYAALVSLAQTIDLFLKNHHRYFISVDEKEKIISIREYVIFLTSFLEDFPEKASRLEGKIRDSANEAEDIIEDFMWKQVRVSWLTIGPSRVEFEHQLREVREEIGLIAGNMMEDQRDDLPAAMSSSRLAPTGKNDLVIGFDDDLMAIKDRLCGESSKLQVIPIVGMGGIGKTTLARNAYDDQLIMEYFDIRAWVTIPQHYNAEQILSSLLASMKLFEEEMLGLKEEYKVYKSLKGRRYLIVMDDVWSTKAWDDVKNIFPDDNNGSRIMLTTRLLDVAAYADSRSFLHEMQLMNGNQSWNLLKRKVFTNGQSCPPELEDTGKGIALSCKGLPLAVVLVAGILSSVLRTRASWEEIAKNVISLVDGQLEKILSMSYRILPHHLRSCFLFIGGFPEDFQIRVSKLIKLWVAEGFLKHQDGYGSLEEEAEQYLEDLVKRSLVLVTSRKSNGKIKSCSLHDLVRDLCIRKAQEEKFLLHVRGRCDLPQSIKNERRISISHSHIDHIANILYPTIHTSDSLIDHIANILYPTVHTILCFRHVRIWSSLLAFIIRFRLLRVLVVDNSLEFPPSQLFELFHLRYLALGNAEEIPSAISNFENLQTLIINPKSAQPNSYLPLEIWRMPRLRHLVLPLSYLLPNPADGLNLPLENLQTLSGVRGIVWSEKILKMIPNLKKLGILYAENRKYHLHNLILLHQLEKLKVTMQPYCCWLGQNPTFPRTLKKLALVGGRLPWRDMAIVGSLPNLEVLKLRLFACDGDTWETTDRQFCQLNFLLIEQLDLEHWITESSHFPRLKCLKLHFCSSLAEIPKSIGDISTLELIEVDFGNPCLVASAKQMQEDQQHYGNDTLQFRFAHKSIKTRRSTDNSAVENQC